MDMHSGLSILSGVLILVGFGFYVRSCWRGETVPTKSTWLVLGVLDSITLAGLVVESIDHGKNLVNGQILASAFVGWASFVLACFFGKSGWPLKERMCLLGAGIALTAWAISGSATLGVIMSLVAMVLGAIPMLMSTIENPSSEDSTTWMIYAVSCFAALGGIREWTMAEGSQVLAFTIIEVTMAAITWRYKLRHWFS